MEDASERIRRWAKAGEDTALPDWNELPTIRLYMDQVIFYLGENLRFFERDGQSSLLTSSMINNYVKTGVLPHPEKKKYRREHLAALLAVCMLKQVLSIQDIKTLLAGEELSEELYNLFLTTHTAALQETCVTLAENCDTGENLKQKALRLAIEAYAKRAAAERILCELGRDTAEAGKPEKKRQEAE